MESERPDALFHDPYARRLAGERGEQILSAMPTGRGWAWARVGRTGVVSGPVARLITPAGASREINLAAGLDTRPYRLPLPPRLRWYDVDFPDVNTYKREQLAG